AEGLGHARDVGVEERPVLQAEIDAALDCELGGDGGDPDREDEGAAAGPQSDDRVFLLAELPRERDGHHLFGRGAVHRTPPRVEIVSRRSTPTRSRNSAWSRTPNTH